MFIISCDILAISICTKSGFDSDKILIISAYLARYINNVEYSLRYFYKKL